MTGAAARTGVRRAIRFPSFRFLEITSFVHSGIYAALLAVWLLPGLDGPTTVFGWAHGLLWIAMSLVAIEAARRATIPFWLAVVVAVVGGIGPFAGSVGFLVEERRRRASDLAG